MKAIVYSRFGPPDVLELRNVAKPIPKDREVLIRNVATVVAAEDPGMRSSPGLNGIIRPKNRILGEYLAGEIESTGKGVTRFKKGDQIYGNKRKGLGAYAEYVCMPEDGALAIKPANMTYEEAAAIPNGGLTALPFLRDKGHIRSGQKVLVNGASGAVGTAAVQLARYYGADVTGVCSSKNIALVKSLGANKVIDYAETDFARSGQTYDIIFDAVGKSSLSQCRSSLGQGGVYLSTVPTPEVLFEMLWPLKGGNRRAAFSATGLRPESKMAEDLRFLKELIEAGRMRAVIDRCYSLEQIAEAHLYVEGGHKKGNVVITVSDRPMLGG